MSDKEVDSDLNVEDSPGQAKIRKRSRAPAMTSKEKERFLTLVQKYKNILESKKSDTATISKKQSTWKILASKFNAEPDIYPQSADKLKKTWEI